MTACAVRQLQPQPPPVHSRGAPQGPCQPLHDGGAPGDATAAAAQERRIAELEARVAELEDYACSVAHDLRAPIRAARGFAGALEEDYGTALPQGARAFLTKIIGAAQDMDRITVDLLALASADMPAATISQVDCGEILNQALAELAPQRTDRVQIMVGELQNCRGHAGLLRQVWANLLSNALKFTRERERALVEVGSFEADGDVTWFVRDNGVGFHPERARELFLPFRRLHDARRFEGHGIGLAIVRRIVTRHGGRVWADARPGEGATFYFTLDVRHRNR